MNKRDHRTFKQFTLELTKNLPLHIPLFLQLVNIMFKLLHGLPKLNDIA